MNQREWKRLCKINKHFIDWTYFNNTRAIQLSLKHNSDPNAKVIHHLRDTEEQRKYNDEHYELWGHNLDGTFEYGKYVIFVTEELHNNYHRNSLETRERKSYAQYILWQDPLIRKKRIAGIIGHKTSQETRNKISAANSGRKFTDEHREKLCIARRKRIITDSTRHKTSDSLKRVMSDAAHRKRISDTVKAQKQAKKSLYNEYRLSDGKLMWNDFQHFLKLHFEKNYVPTLEELKNALVDEEDIDG